MKRKRNNTQLLPIKFLGALQKWRSCYRPAWLFFLFTLLVLSPAPQALAASHVFDYGQVVEPVVGDGSPASCTEAAFDTVLATVQSSGGGTITFDCGGPAEIVFSSEKKIQADEVVIDGGDQISLNGVGTTRFFRLAPTGRLRLQSITLANGYSATDYGGAIWVETGGTLVLEKSTIRDSKTNGAAGGAIIDFKGSVTLIDSVIEGSKSSYGALNSTGSLTLIRSTLRNNSAEIAGAAISAGGSLLIQDSLIENNFAPAAGALYLTSTAVTTIEGTTFNKNLAQDFDPQKGVGGAVVNFGSLAIKDSLFYANMAARGGAVYTMPQTTVDINNSNFQYNENRDANDEGHGGAIFGSDGSNLTIKESSFQSNFSRGGGGAISFYGTRLILHDNLFEANSATDEGGAIQMRSGDLDVERSSFIWNAAFDNGGAVSCFDSFVSIIDSGLAFNGVAGGGGAIYSACSLNMSNVTLSNNKVDGTTNVPGSGGALFQSGDQDAFLQYVTIVGNSAADGGGLFNDSLGSSISISRSMIAANGAANCGGTITSTGWNFSDDAGCPAFIQTGDKQNANLPLAPYGDNGGAAGSQLPLPGNQAINAIPIAQCAASTDQRGGPRPTGSGCDSGALEVGSFLFRLSLPLIIK